MGKEWENIANTGSENGNERLGTEEGIPDHLISTDLLANGTLNWSIAVKMPADMLVTPLTSIDLTASNASLCKSSSYVTYYSRQGGYALPGVCLLFCYSRNFGEHVGQLPMFVGSCATAHAHFNSNLCQT